MTRYNLIKNKKVPFTKNQEIEKNAEEAAWAAKQSDRNLEALREERNRLLTETDYLALSDNTMTSAMSTYRQALRDVTDNATSLDNVTWPTKP